jgi:hypothetical protein
MDLSLLERLFKDDILLQNEECGAIEQRKASHKYCGEYFAIGSQTINNQLLIG